MRRVLLSSLTGAAVTTVRIEGVLHEFSTIPGVTEDVTGIILNVKSLRFKLHTDKAKTIRLKKKGPGEAKASDIIHDADISILNPDLHVATLDKEATLDMEMVVKPGRGYVPAERNKEEGLPIGVLAVDSIYSPVKRVNFQVENARVGRITDYDKLTLEIWTDGAYLHAMHCPKRRAFFANIWIFSSIRKVRAKRRRTSGRMTSKAR